MGYIRHHAMIVTGWDKQAVDRALLEAVTLFNTIDPEAGEHEGWAVVTPIMVSPINGYFSFFIAPDGSKEGWSTSDRGDRKREAFKAFLRDFREKEHAYLDWAEIQYGDDNYETKIVSHSDAQVDHES